MSHDRNPVLCGTSKRQNTIWVGRFICLVRRLHRVMGRGNGLTDGVGLTHLATPYYEKALQLSELNSNRMTSNGSSSRTDGNDQDFAREAAYNLQSIYSASGNAEMARKVTAEYLVI